MARPVGEDFGQGRIIRLFAMLLAMFLAANPRRTPIRDGR
jgi:hypothetical protein